MSPCTLIGEICHRIYVLNLFHTTIYLGLKACCVHGYFCPVFFRPSTLANDFCPVLNSSRQVEIHVNSLSNLKHWNFNLFFNSPSLKFAR